MRVKTEQRRQAIIDAAKHEFALNGFSETSMSTIAKRLGGSKATLYNYFSSKEEIFAAVLESAAVQMSTAFHGLNPDAEPRPTLCFFGQNYLASLCSPELSSIVKMAFSEADRSNIGVHFYQIGPKRGLQHLTEYLQALIERKQIKPCEPLIAARQLKALLEAELREPYALGLIPQPDQETINTVVERAVDSFLTLYQQG